MLVAAAVLSGTEVVYVARIGIVLQNLDIQYRLVLLLFPPHKFARCSQYRMKAVSYSQFMFDGVYPLLGTSSSQRVACPEDREVVLVAKVGN